MEMEMGDKIWLKFKTIEIFLISDNDVVCAYFLNHWHLGDMQQGN